MAIKGNIIDVRLCGKKGTGKSELVFVMEKVAPTAYEFGLNRQFVLQLRF